MCNFQEREHVFLFLLLLPPCCNADEMTGALGALLDHEMTLGMEATYGRAKKIGESLTPHSSPPTLELPVLNVTKKETSNFSKSHSF